MLQLPRIPCTKEKINTIKYYIRLLVLSFRNKMKVQKSRVSRICWENYCTQSEMLGNYLDV